MVLEEGDIVVTESYWLYVVKGPQFRGQRELNGANQYSGSGIAAEAVIWCLDSAVMYSCKQRQGVVFQMKKCDF